MQILYKINSRDDKIHALSMQRNKPFRDFAAIKPVIRQHFDVPFIWPRD